MIHVLNLESIGGRDVQAQNIIKCTNDDFYIDKTRWYKCPFVKQDLETANFIANRIIKNIMRK